MSVLDGVNSKTTKSQLLDILTTLAAEQELQKNALESFKNRVYQVALEKKSELSWCDEGFAEAMSELGIEPPARYKRVTIVVDVDLTDGHGPFGYALDEIADIEEYEVVDSVLNCLDHFDRETINVAVETLSEKPAKVFSEKVYKTNYSNRYSGGGF